MINERNETWELNKHFATEVKKDLDSVQQCV